MASLVGTAVWRQHRSLGVLLITVVLANTVQPSLCAVIRRTSQTIRKNSNSHALPKNTGPPGVKLDTIHDVLKHTEAPAIPDIVDRPAATTRTTSDADNRHKPGSETRENESGLRNEVTGSSSVPADRRRDAACQLFERKVTIRKKHCEEVTLTVNTCEGMCPSYTKFKKRFPYLKPRCTSCQADPATISMVSGIQRCRGRKGDMRLFNITLPSTTSCNCHECTTKLQLRDPSNRVKLP